jgi:ABC-type bacteriocin/lantibiotic exporter with double-glycine peptidase domain
VLLGGCYTGLAHPVSPAQIARDPGWLLVRAVPFHEQRAENDCGAAALAMVLQYWGLPVTPIQITAAHAPVPQGHGLRAGELRDFSRSRGLQAFLVHGQLDDLTSELARNRPVIVGLGKPHGRAVYAHYEVVVGLHAARQRVLTLDPARGWRENSWTAFQAEWAAATNLLLVVFRMDGVRDDRAAEGSGA